MIFKAIGAALAIGFAAFATAWAQSKIGSAAAGAMAEKPEIGGLMIVLEALPETIIILGFVIAIMIVGMK
ncbi:MAG: ATPase [Candidatus Edwardsbacteria bacterium]|nr:ATPase [Candidatus Edwardsbacteria bacterium]